YMSTHFRPSAKQCAAEFLTLFGQPLKAMVAGAALLVIVFERPDTSWIQTASFAAVDNASSGFAAGSQTHFAAPREASAPGFPIRRISVTGAAHQVDRVHLDILRSAFDHMGSDAGQLDTEPFVVAGKMEGAASCLVEAAFAMQTVHQVGVERHGADSCSDPKHLASPLLMSFFVQRAISVASLGYALCHAGNDHFPLSLRFHCFWSYLGSR
ncbi:MAG: hypothetical protein K6T83_08345, partial [Alicyclobacillus sp.]|nr:hypothetical protein [Alicyclobacillus sp.]